MNKSEFFNTLKKENLTHLELSAGVTRQALHNALKSQNMKLDNLQAVAKAMGLELEFSPLGTEGNLLSSLAKFGVPLAHSKDGTMKFEDVVKKALVKSRQDGAYETFVPYLLLKNALKLKPLLLASKAFEANEVNALGYFVELANAFRPNKSFEKTLELLSVAKSSEKEFLVKTEKSNFPELFEKNKLAVKWNLKVRGTVNDHFQRWEKWEQSLKAK